jgi:hypothetical protein
MVRQQTTSPSRGKASKTAAAPDRYAAHPTIDPSTMALVTKIDAKLGTSQDSDDMGTIGPPDPKALLEERKANKKSSRTKTVRESPATSAKRPIGINMKRQSKRDETATREIRDEPPREKPPPGIIAVSPNITSVVSEIHDEFNPNVEQIQKIMATGGEKKNLVRPKTQNQTPSQGKPLQMLKPQVEGGVKAAAPDAKKGNSPSQKHGSKPPRTQTSGPRVSREAVRGPITKRDSTSISSRKPGGKGGKPGSVSSRTARTTASSRHSKTSRTQGSVSSRVTLPNRQWSDDGKNYKVMSRSAPPPVNTMNISSMFDFLFLDKKTDVAELTRMPLPKTVKKPDVVQVESRTKGGSVCTALTKIEVFNPESPTGGDFVRQMISVKENSLQKEGSTSGQLAAGGSNVLVSPKASPVGDQCHVRISLGYLTGVAASVTRRQGTSQGRDNSLVVGYAEVAGGPRLKSTKPCESQPIIPQLQPGSSSSYHILLWASRKVPDKTRSRLYASVSRDSRKKPGKPKAESLYIVVGVKQGEKKLPLGIAAISVDFKPIDGSMVDLPVVSLSDPRVRAQAKALTGSKTTTLKFANDDTVYGLSSKAVLRARVDVKETSLDPPGPAAWHDDAGDDESFIHSMASSVAALSFEGDKSMAPGEEQFIEENLEWIEVFPHKGTHTIITSTIDSGEDNDASISLQMLPLNRNQKIPVLASSPRRVSGQEVRLTKSGEKEPPSTKEPIRKPPSTIQIDRSSQSRASKTEAGTIDAPPDADASKVDTAGTIVTSPSSSVEQDQNQKSSGSKIKASKSLENLATATLPSMPSNPTAVSARTRELPRRKARSQPARRRNGRHRNRSYDESEASTVNVVPPSKTQPQTLSGLAGRFLANLGLVQSPTEGELTANNSFASYHSGSSSQSSSSFSADAGFTITSAEDEESRCSEISLSSSASSSDSDDVDEVPRAVSSEDWDGETEKDFANATGQIVAVARKLGMNPAELLERIEAGDDLKKLRRRSRRNKER